MCCSESSKSHTRKPKFISNVYSATVMSIISTAQNTTTDDVFLLVVKL